MDSDLAEISRSLVEELSYVKLVDKGIVDKDIICDVVLDCGFYGCPNPTFLAGFGNFAERVNFKEVPPCKEGILLLLQGVCYRVDGILKRGEIRVLCARGGSA
ncbi:hypothetical protein CDAR_37241 [Caerostris darwini]|uniref:Uncharacterized protein n=1 Tax=Caerostris darwini TaxID=1538125 RepID=A0AAV4SF85_9ARAC|nr:hypothetical protein CDAR_37241 [Caerostris darwini]